MHRSDKWLKQAGIVDEDFITTTDTAILFRKMSRFGIEFCYTTILIELFWPRFKLKV